MKKLIPILFFLVTSCYSQADYSEPKNKVEFNDLIELGNYNYDNKKVDKALHYYTLSYSSSSKKADSINALGGLIQSCIDLKKYPDAKKYALELKRLDTKNKWVDSKIIIINNNISSIENFIKTYIKQQEDNTGGGGKLDKTIKNEKHIVITYSLEGMGGGNNWGQFLAVFNTENKKLIKDVSIGGKFQRQCTLEKVENDIITLDSKFPLPKEHYLQSSGRGKVMFGITNDDVYELNK